jgi:hypothetical protein
MRITLFTHGIRGDVWPFIALGHHLRERDHDITLAAPPNYAAPVRAAGLRYGPLPFDSEAFLASDEGRHLTAVGGVRMVRALQAVDAAHARAADDAFLEASEGAEALVAMHVTMERAQVIAEHRRLPLAMVWPIPLTPTGEFTSPVIGGRELPTRALRRASHQLFHRVWAAGSAGQTAALRRRLGLPSSRTPAFYRHQEWADADLPSAFGPRACAAATTRAGRSAAMAAVLDALFDSLRAIFDTRPRVYSSSTGWKPPQNIRRPSKGISICIASGSALIFSFAASRVALSGYSIQLKMTVSSSFACVARKKSVTSPRGTSSPQHSVTRVAPRFLKYSAPCLACSM